jgi:hypothetical protein
VRGEVLACPIRRVGSRDIVDGIAMAKMAYFLALSGLVLGGCHLLPRSPPGRSLTACLFVVIGFIGTQGMLSGTIQPSGWFREDPSTTWLNI